jgi:O-antigen/teichoic acid export membrane protein
MNDLGARSLTAVFWGGGGAVARILLQFGTQVVLARLLGPEQYGIFAIGAVVVSFSNFFADVGIAYGLIQKKTVANTDLRFITTWQFIIGSLVSLTVVLASGPIAAFFGESRAGDVVQALAIICLINALAAPSLNMLKRNMDFKSLQIAQLLAYVVGYVIIGVPLAMMGWQAWALVIAWLVQSVVMLAMLYAYVRHPLRPLLWFADASSLMKYGLTVLTTNLINWLINNVDRVIVGRVFTSKEIGLYATSYNMLYNPTSSLLGTLQPVFFSASSRLSDDKPRIAAGYKTLVGCITLFVLPAFVGLAVVSHTFALALYGQAWATLGSTLQPLALAMPLFLLWGMTTPLLWTGGDASREFKSQLPLAIVWIGAAWFAAQISLVAVAWAVFGLFLCRFAVILRSAVRLLDLNVAELWRAARGGLIASAICAVVLSAADFFLQTWSVAPLFRLMVEVVLGGATLLLSLRLIPGLVGMDVVPLIEKVAARAPNPIARFLRALPNTRAST